MTCSVRLSGDLSTRACRHNINGSDCFLSDMFTVTGLWLCFDLCCGRICFWIDGSSTFYFWQGIISVIINISIRSEITLSLGALDVIFLPQTSCFQNLIYFSCCNHVFEDIFTVMNEANVRSLCHQQTFDRHFNGPPNIRSARVKTRESKPLITSHWMLFCGSFKFCPATIKKLNNTTQRKL